MAIDKVSNNVTEVRTVNKQAESRNERIKDELPQKKETKVSISEEAIRLNNNESIQFDRKKVEDIKKSINEGSFKIDPEKIADKARDLETEMMKARLQKAYDIKRDKNEGVLSP